MGPLKVALGLVILLIAVACSGAFTSSGSSRDDSLGQTLQRLAQQAPIGSSVDLADVYGEQWTHVALFPAYSTNVVAREVLGFDLDVESAPHQNEDGSYAVVFADDDAVLTWFVIEPNGVGFDALTLPVSADRSSAAARIKLDEYGERVLDVSVWR